MGSGQVAGAAQVALPCFVSRRCCTLTSVEHPCPKCRAPVEDGVPFCKACHAPQIRVPGFEGGEPVVVSEIHSAEEHESALPSSLATPAQSSRIKWSDALPCAAVGGVFSLLLVIPLALLRAGSSAAPLVFGAAFMAGGAWSVRIYYRKMKEAPIRPSTGAQIGAASGGFGFLFFAVLAVATVVYQAAEMRKAMADALDQATKRGADPEVARRVLEFLKTPEGLASFVAFGLFVMLLIFVIGASIGGAWYSAWLRKRAGL